MQAQVITRNNLGEGFIIDPSTKTISVAKRVDLGTFKFKFKYVTTL